MSNCARLSCIDADMQPPKSGDAIRQAINFLFEQVQLGHHPIQRFMQLSDGAVQLLLHAALSALRAILRGERGQRRGAWLSRCTAGYNALVSADESMAKVLQATREGWHGVGLKWECLIIELPLEFDKKFFTAARKKNLGGSGRCNELGWGAFSGLPPGGLA